jgi:hypothetical protein
VLLSLRNWNRLSFIYHYDKKELSNHLSAFSQIEEPTQVIGYIHVSLEEQDLAKQKHLRLKYTQ